MVRLADCRLQVAGLRSGDAALHSQAREALEAAGKTMGWSGVDFEHRRLRDLMRRAGGFVADEMADDTPRALIAAAVGHLDAGDHALTQDDRAGARRHYDAANDLLLDVDPVDVRDGDGFRSCAARAFSGVAPLESLEEDFGAAAAAADRAVDWLRLSDAGDGDVAAQPTLPVAHSRLPAAGARLRTACPRQSRCTRQPKTRRRRKPSHNCEMIGMTRPPECNRSICDWLHLRVPRLTAPTPLSPKARYSSRCGARRPKRSVEPCWERQSGALAWISKTRS